MSGWVWIRIGALSAGLAVAAGAFGVHGLKGKFEADVRSGLREEPDARRMLEVFETAARYQMYHALGLLAVGLLMAAGRPAGGSLQVAGWGFLVGTLVFSGSLYALPLTGLKWLGAITPIGGVAFLVGWLALALSAAGAPRP